MTSPPADCEPDWTDDPDDEWPDRIHPDLRGQHAHERTVIHTIRPSEEYL